MDLLEMPLEAVALRFYSLPAVVAGGSIWTCLAIIATAVGLWRIRTVGFRSDASSSHLLTSPPPSPPPPPPPAAPKERPILRRVELDAPPPSPREEAGTPKVRFTAYFAAADCLGCCRVDDGDGEDGEDDVADAVGGGGGGGGDGEKRLAKSWEGGVPRWDHQGLQVLRRNGDLGWYRYQDMAALNGSVVRLWNGDGDLTASPRRRGRMGIY